MARIMTRQTGLKKTFWKKAIPGLIAVIAGISIIFASILFAKETVLIGVGVVIGVFILVAGISLILRNKNFLSGAKGEKMVSKTLASFPDDWYVFNDVIIRDTQIDHILVCPKGIYTIETKHYRGSISGNAEARDWWQFIRFRQTGFYNPVRQTLHHVRALVDYLRESGYSKVCVEPVVVFSHPEVKLEVVSPKVPVIYLSQLTEFLNSRTQMMESHQCEEISTLLNNYLSGNIKKNRFITLWLPVSIIIVVVLGVLWWITTTKSVPNQEPVSPPKNVSKYPTVEEGEIKSINKDKNGKRCFLNFKDGEKPIIVIFLKDFPLSYEDIKKEYKKGEKIRVTGEISEYNGEREIIVNSPDQIKIVE